MRRLLQLGVPTQALYIAMNPEDDPITGQATYNVSPAEASLYFVKTECFCFTEQILNSNESREMPVYFYIKPDLPDHIQEITLSYTFFRQGYEPSACCAMFRSQYPKDLMMLCHIVRGLISLPEKGIGQGDFLNVIWQIRLDVKIYGHFPAFVRIQYLFGKTETLGFYKIKTGFGRRHVISSLTGDWVVFGVHRDIQCLSGYSELNHTGFFFWLKNPR